MKKTILFFAAILSLSTTFAQVYVGGYFKSNGTYVEGHWRTEPNSTRNDNWSTVGNTNPYTGCIGTKQGGYNSSYNNTFQTSYPTVTNYDFPTNHFDYPTVPRYDFSIPSNFNYPTVPSYNFSVPRYNYSIPNNFNW
jgi:hypothetical protein